HFHGPCRGKRPGVQLAARPYLSCFFDSGDASRSLPWLSVVDDVQARLRERSPRLQGLSQWARLGSNRRPPACEAGALPLSYAPGGTEDTAGCSGLGTAAGARIRIRTIALNAPPKTTMQPVIRAAFRPWAKALPAICASSGWPRATRRPDELTA